MGPEAVRPFPSLPEASGAGPGKEAVLSCGTAGASDGPYCVVKLLLFLSPVVGEMWKAPACL